jgi:general secretion pathway protein G
MTKDLRLRTKYGFTLIELLVVVSLIGVLATLVIANLNSARERARDSQRKSDLRSIQTALRLYYNDNSSTGFPNSSSYNIVGCDGACTWGEAWVNESITYMNILPKDPLTGQSYRYTASADNEGYTLEACLENKSDDKGVSTTDTTWCPSGWKYVVSP